MASGWRSSGCSRVGTQTYDRMRVTRTNMSGGQTDAERVSIPTDRTVGEHTYVP
jgi:hypothetical protein